MLCLNPLWGWRRRRVCNRWLGLIALLPLLAFGLLNVLILYLLVLLYKGTAAAESRDADVAHGVAITVIATSGSAAASAWREALEAAEGGT